MVTIVVVAVAAGALAGVAMSRSGTSRRSASWRDGYSWGRYRDEPGKHVASPSNQMLFYTSKESIVAVLRNPASPVSS